MTKWRSLLFYYFKEAPRFRKVVSSIIWKVHGETDYGVNTRSIFLQSVKINLIRKSRCNLSRNHVSFVSNRGYKNLYPHLLLIILKCMSECVRVRVCMSSSICVYVCVWFMYVHIYVYIMCYLVSFYQGIERVEYVGMTVFSYDFRRIGGWQLHHDVLWSDAFQGVVVMQFSSCGGLHG